MMALCIFVCTFTLVACSGQQTNEPLTLGVNAIITEIDKALQKERGQKIDSLRVKLAFADAMASTSRGFFDESDSILQEIAKDYAYVIDNPNLVCDWNTINIINKK